MALWKAAGIHQMRLTEGDRRAGILPAGEISQVP